MSILLDLKIILKTGAVIALQLLESQRQQRVIGAEANPAKLETVGVGIPTSVPGTAIRLGIEIDRRTKTALETNGIAIDRRGSK
jgi:hypothetical protein